MSAATHSEASSFFFTTMSTATITSPPHKRTRVSSPPLLGNPLEASPMAIDPPPQTVGRKPKETTPEPVDLSVFDILNIFHRRWFLSRANLLANVISAQKAEDGKISWVEFTPQFHSHLVKCAVTLVPRPVPRVKKVMFAFILELLNGEGHMAFFELQKGGRKANNAQKEKWRLAWKRSRAAKRERDREAAKAAKLPPRERQCVACGRKFKSHKRTSKHKCPDSKVVHSRELRLEAEVQVSLALKPSTLDTPMAPPTPPVPPAPSHIHVTPEVTGVFPGLTPVENARLHRLLDKQQFSPLEFTRDEKLELVSLQLKLPPGHPWQPF